MGNFLKSIGVAALTLLAYSLTVNNLTKPYGFSTLLIVVLILAPVYIFGVKRAKQISPTTSNILVFGATAAVLLWVGLTGWFFSPFFWLLYLWGIALAFLYNIWVSLAFVLILIVLFIPNVGQVEKNFDILTLLSLVMVIPLAHYLRREYLRLRESEKKILILEKEHEKHESKVEEILANAVTKVAVDLREYFEEIRQMTNFSEQLKTRIEMEKYRQRILSSSEKGLGLLKKFEEDVTGKKLLTGPGATPKDEGYDLLKKRPHQ